MSKSSELIIDDSLANGFVIRSLLAELSRKNIIEKSNIIKNILAIADETRRAEVGKVLNIDYSREQALLLVESTL